MNTVTSEQATAIYASRRAWALAHRQLQAVDSILLSVRVSVENASVRDDIDASAIRNIAGSVLSQLDAIVAKVEEAEVQ